MITESDIQKIRNDAVGRDDRYIIYLCDEAFKGDRFCRLQLQRVIEARGHETIPSATSREPYRPLVPPPRRDD